MEDGGLGSQSPSPHLSGGRGFYKEGEGNRPKKSREEVEKFSVCRLIQSIPIRQMMVYIILVWSPRLLSSWLHIILVPQLRVSKSPGAGMPGSQSLYLLKRVPRILMQM